MDNLTNWLYTLVSDIEDGIYFDALADVEQVKICLMEMLKKRNEDLLRKAQ